MLGISISGFPCQFPAAADCKVKLWSRFPTDLSENNRENFKGSTNLYMLSNCPDQVKN